MQTIKEGLAKIEVPAANIVSKAMRVFYNPVMSVNRDISILLLNSIKEENLQIADVLAASGVRSIRFLKELEKGKIKNISINDHDKGSIALIRKNLELNKIPKSRKIEISNEDASLFLLKSNGFDYIEIDPFGTPNPFLDAACKRVSRNGILAVTATDTSALCGTYHDACKRKYWAAPKSSSQMHEIGLRILIRKAQLVAAQYDKALVPVFSYAKDHYMRIFLRAGKGKNKADEILKQHKMLNGTGPLWAGNLWDGNLAKKMWRNGRKSKIFSCNRELIRFLEIIKEESKIDSVGFYDIHDLCRRYRLHATPKKAELIKEITKKGFKASETHFKGEGIRSDIGEKNLVGIMKKSR